MRSGAPPGNHPFLHSYGSSGTGTGGVGNGVVVVGLVGKDEEELSQVLDRLLDHRIFGQVPHAPVEPATVPGGAKEFEEYSALFKNRFKHHYDNERGILFVCFSWGSGSMQLVQNEEEYENVKLRGLLFMFLVCHVLLMVQDGAKFDPKLLRLFRLLQAAKTARLRASQPRNIYPGNSAGRTGRQAPTLSFMSGLSHTLFPGQCTPVLLLVCIDDFPESESLDSSARFSKSPIARAPGKLEQSTRRKFLSSVEGQARFLIKKCRSLLGFGDGISSGMGPRGPGNVVSGGPALFAMDPSRVVLFLDRSSSRSCDALEAAITVLDDILKGKPGADFYGLEATGDDVQAVRDFIWRQAELIRGRGGNPNMSGGVGMVAAAAAAAAASTMGSLRPTSNPPELPSVATWLASSNMVIDSVMKAEFRLVDESDISFNPRVGRRSLADSNPRNLSEPELSFPDTGMDINMKFSILWCKKALPAARAVYTRGLSACYPTTVHNHHLEKALSAFRSNVRGPAVSAFLEKLRMDCENFWRSGRQQCDSVSLTGRPCMHQIHAVEDTENSYGKPHCSGAVFLSACSCGKTRMLREDPFDVTAANISFYNFHDCKAEQEYVVLPPDSSAWSILRLGCSKDYQHSIGLQLTGFCNDQNDLSHYDIPLFFKSPGQDPDGPRATKLSNDHHGNQTVKKLFQETKARLAEKQKPPEVKLNYNEESAFPPLQKSEPKSKQKPPTKAPEVKNQQLEQAVENGPRTPSKTDGPVNRKDVSDVGLYVGYEYECPRGHRYFLSVELMQKLGAPYSQQAGIEKKHKRVRRRQNPDRLGPMQARPLERFQDGLVNSLGEFNISLENLSIGEPVGDGRVLSNANLPIFMECPHCKTCSGNDEEENFASAVSRLQRIYMVTPPLPLLMASRPMVQFDETVAPNSKSDFTVGCEVVLPSESLLCLRLPFVYSTENADGSLSPLLYNEDHPEHTAWLVKGTAFYVASGSKQ